LDGGRGASEKRSVAIETIARNQPVMRQFELVERVAAYNPNTDEALLNKAYVYAMRAHGQQKRASGDPYISHPLAVAAILANLRLDDATIVTALLHDTLEDTEATKAEIERVFGPTIAGLVDGLTKIDRLNFVSKQAEQAENFRKLLIAISTDVRVLLVKLADRLHNMRTLEHMKPEKRKRIAQETMDIYAPLAGRMGIQEIRDELEELSFKWLHPSAYETLMSRLRLVRHKNTGLIGEIASELKNRLESQGMAAEVTSREKKPYSIWLKMQNKQISLEQLSDIYGFRVLVTSVDDCYRALGVVHTTWRVVPGRFKDYISTPKHNDYQSIHTTIVGPQFQRVELQIRTAEMHQIAEYGIAAHSGYKLASLKARKPAASNGAASPQETDVSESAAYRWLRRLVDNLLEGDNPEEFLEHTKLELFQDQVFCFTPKGRLIALPRGANSIDFAYAVHTNVGNRCVGTKINGRHMPLLSELRNGDEVEITLSDTQVPPAAWEHAVITGKARAAIRKAAREAQRKQSVALGRDIFKSACERAGKATPDAEAAALLQRANCKTVEDFYAAVGKGDFSTEDLWSPEGTVADRTAPVIKRRAITRTDEGWFNLRRVTNFRFRWPTWSEAANVEGKPAISVRSMSGMPVRFADGGAIPGDRVVGVLEPGGITIYPIHSPLLRDLEDRLDRWIDVAWNIQEGSSELFPCRVRVTALNEPGSLAQIAGVIGGAGANIDKLTMVNRARDYTEMLLDLEVIDTKHLNEILTGVTNLTVVSSAERVT
jgi:RelA/SpoT family (p)ppGpp synthetase